MLRWVELRVWKELNIGLLRLGAELLLQPVLAVDVLGDDVGGDVVHGGVDHGGGRIDEVSQGPGDGQSQTDLLGEEDGAEHHLARAAAAGDAGHGDRGEHRHDDGEHCAAGGEVLAEEGEEEGNLDDGAHG